MEFFENRHVLSNPDQNFLHFAFYLRQSFSPVTDVVFFSAGQFGKRFIQRGVIEYRIVTETVATDRLLGNQPLAACFVCQGLSGRYRNRYNAFKGRPAVCFAGQFGQQPGTAFGVGGVISGKARGLYAWCAAESFDDQAGIVGQRR